MERNMLKFFVLSLVMFLFACESSAGFYSEDVFNNYFKGAVSDRGDSRCSKFYKLHDNATKQQKLITFTYVMFCKYKEGEYEAAKVIAQTALFEIKAVPANWNTGNVLHKSYTMLGLVSIEDGEVTKSKQYLMESCNVPITPQLKTYGPNMILADILYDKGEVKAVKDYLNACKLVWKKGINEIDSWLSAIDGGGKPYFTRNIRPD